MKNNEQSYNGNSWNVLYVSGTGAFYCSGIVSVTLNLPVTFSVPFLSTPKTICSYRIRISDTIALQRLPITAHAIKSYEAIKCIINFIIQSLWIPEE